MNENIKKMSLSAKILSIIVRGYQKILSPFKPACCRFTPTCSTYALQALKEHGALYGSWLTLKRILRCHPLGGSGYDPVPVKKKMLFKSRRTLYAFLFTAFVAFMSLSFFYIINHKTKVSHSVRKELASVLYISHEQKSALELPEELQSLLSIEDEINQIHNHHEGFLSPEDSKAPQSLAAKFLIKCIRFYQEKISTHLGAPCRFEPTCSNYGIQALERFGAIKGSWLTLKRILRCNPWGGKGKDPVPERKKTSSSTSSS